MSWQAYVDTNLVGSQKFKRAAILGLAGGVWAASPGFTLSPDEQKAVVAAFSNPDTIRANGFRLAGTKFFTLSAEGRTIQGKKQGDGAILVKTNQAVLIGEYVAPTQAPEASIVIESLADYLIGLQY